VNTDRLDATNGQGSGSGYIQVEVTGTTGNIALARPEKRNAMSRAMVHDLIEAVATLSLRPELDVIILRGQGPAFCAGGDLTEAAERRLDHESAHSLLALGAKKNAAIEESDKLVVAAVDGPAHAGGLLLCLCADLTIATSRARFRVPELLRGRPDPFIPPRLVRRIGIERAKWMMFTAAEIDARTAADWGLVSSIAPSFGLEEAIDSLVAAIRATEPTSRTVWKRYLRGLSVVDGAAELDFAKFFERESVHERSRSFFVGQPENRDSGRG
jgi:enoyl-CoA hydratase/carnithine racemase